MKPVEIRQHDDGTWYARPYLGTNKVTGKPIRPYKRFPDASCEEEALEMARDWAATLAGMERIGASASMSDMLARYIEENRASWAANTEKAYRNCARWLDPVIGDVDADEMRPALVEAAYNVLRIRGGRDGKALSQASVRQCHDFLCGAFRWLVKAEVSPFNPMPSVRKPRLDRVEATAFHGGDFAELRDSIVRGMADPSTADGAACVAAYLSLVTGMRCGEACALAVRDVSLASRSVHVAATVVEPRGSGPVRQSFTKGRRARNVSLGADSCETISEIIERREGFLPENRRRLKNLPVACSPSGGFLRPSAVSRRFTDLRRSLDLPDGTSFHTLRHTHATMLIAAGADMRTVQERLGHANVSTTLSIYAHLVPGRDRDAADAFDGAMRGTP